MFMADKKEIGEKCVKLKSKLCVTKDSSIGRPKKDSTKVRNKRFTLRFTVAEWESLNRMSKEFNLSKADLLRQFTLPIKQFLSMRQSIPADIIALLRNLESLSGAVLQLSHKVGHEMTISTELKQTALQLSNIVQQTYDYLEEGQ